MAHNRKITTFKKAPQFSDYPVKDIYRGRPAAVKLTSHLLARTFRTVLRDGAELGPNFAGHFTLVSWGCGTSCQSFGIVDAKTGQVAFVLSKKETIPPAAVGFDFRIDSSLLIVNQIDALEAEDPFSILRLDDSRCYVWRANKLALVFVRSPKRPIQTK